MFAQFFNENENLFRNPLTFILYFLGTFFTCIILISREVLYRYYLLHTRIYFYSKINNLFLKNNISQICHIDSFQVCHDSI